MKRARKKVVCWDGGAGKPSILALLQKFRPGLKRLASKHHIGYREIVSEAAEAFATASIGLDVRRGSLDRRWWYVLTKRLRDMGPKNSDALAHVIQNVSRNCDE